MGMEIENTCEMCGTPFDVVGYHIQYQAVDRTVQLCSEHGEPIRKLIRATRGWTKRLPPILTLNEAKKIGPAGRVTKQRTISALRRAKDD